MGTDREASGGDPVREDRRGRDPSNPGDDPGGDQGDDRDRHAAPDDRDDHCRADRHDRDDATLPDDTDDRDRTDGRPAAPDRTDDRHRDRTGADARDDTDDRHRDRSDDRPAAPDRTDGHDIPDDRHRDRSDDRPAAPDRTDDRHRDRTDADARDDTDDRPAPHSTDRDRDGDDDDGYRTGDADPADTRHPRVPDSPSSDAPSVPTVDGVSLHRPASEHGTVPAGSPGPAAEDEEATTATGPTPAPDGGTVPANVTPDGDLRDVEFTEPVEGASQDVYETPADERVGVPEGVDLETPDYGIRREMNDVDTPDDKTWFMELDEAVIDEGRCIQCGTCVAACPSDSIGVGDDDLPELVKMCTGCSLCWDFCPRGGLRYERQWKITGGDDNVSGAGDPITEFSAKVTEDWREDAQDGGLVTSVLIHLLEAGEIDGALIATESDDEPWKAESFLATTPAELRENAGSFYNQTMALGNLDLRQWGHKLPDVPPEELSLALVGTPCEIEGIRAVQDFDWDYQSHEGGVRAVEYTIALMCTKNFNYERLVAEQLEAKRGIPPEDIGKLDVLHGDMIVYGTEGEEILREDVEAFHDAALKGCDECADFTGYCADLAVGSVGSSDEYSSVIVRTERGLEAWELTEPDLEYHDLEDRSAIGGLQSWDKEQAFEALERPFDPDAPRFVDYTDHAEQYGTEVNPHEAGH